MAIEAKLIEQVKHFSACVTELEGYVVKGKEIVADPMLKFKAAEDGGDDVAYERDGLQICLVQSQRGQDKKIGSITHVHGMSDCFSAALKTIQKFMERRADDKVHEKK